MSKVTPKPEERALYYKWLEMTPVARKENGYPATKTVLAKQLQVSVMTLQYWGKAKIKKNKVQVEGVIKEITLLSTEQQKQWWVERMPVLNDVLFKIATDKDIPKATQVKALELIKKEVGAVTDKHEITIINPEDIARRGIEAAREIKAFEYKMLPIPAERVLAPMLEAAEVAERQRLVA